MSKRLVVCCDEGSSAAPTISPPPGTVHRLASMIEPVGRDGTEQIVHCVEPPGGTRAGTCAPVRRVAHEEAVLEAYRFLVANFADRDTIFLFGHGHGAAAVHAVADLIRGVGLLRRENADLVRDAFRYYCGEGPRGGPEGDRTTTFRQRLARDPGVCLVGVWDAFRPEWGRRDFRVPGNVRNAFHAVAIDERDGDRSPALWTGAEGRARVEQVWFPGSHADLAGRGSEAALAEAPLRWMVERARECGLAVGEPRMAGSPSARSAPAPAAPAAFHRIERPRVREIGVTWGASESVHRSALLRLGSDPDGYAPRNLLRYLAREWRKGFSRRGAPVARSGRYESIRDSITRQRIESAASTSYSSNARPRTCPSS